MSEGIVSRGAVALFNFDREVAGEPPVSDLTGSAEAADYWYRSRAVLQAMREPLEAIAAIAAAAADPAAAVQSLLRRVLDESLSEPLSLAAE